MRFLLLPCASYYCAAAPISTKIRAYARFDYFTFCHVLAADVSPVPLFRFARLPLVSMPRLRA